MTRFIIGLAVVMLFAVTANAAGRPWLPSKAESVDQSLDSLLDDGWQIIQGSMGFEGFVVTLQKRGKVILCEWSPRENGQSRCYRLN